jgi:WD40 repeat protein
VGCASRSDSPKSDEAPPAREDRAKNDPESRNDPDPKSDKNPDPKLRAPKEIASFKVPNENRYLDAARFAPDGKTLVTSSTYGHNCDVKFVDVPSGKEKQTRASEGFAGSFAFAPDGRFYVAFESAKEHQVRVWDLGKNQLVKTFKLPTKVRGLDLSRTARSWPAFTSTTAAGFWTVSFRSST